MKEFDKGWWNCFLSYTDEITNVYRNADMVIFEQMRSAGIKYEELNEILANISDWSISERTYQLLLLARSNYLNNGHI